ncbi:MAG TPA: hypothetical protein VG011_10725 [Steroidobacteraceae bacterium]|jgi:hypothetical protein|nr:hypothetical protein [Steroidobacteraceae bacterium]
MKVNPMKDANHRPISVFAWLALLALTASCASLHGGPLTRQQCLVELVSDANVEGAIERAHTESLAESHRSIERIKIEFAEPLAGMNAQQREKFDAATDRFAIASRPTSDVTQAASVWAESFAADFTDEDLRKVVEFGRTPAGRQAMASSLDAATQLHAYLAKKSGATLEKATQQYLAEIKAITGGSAAH